MSYVYEDNVARPTDLEVSYERYVSRISVGLRFVLALPHIFLYLVLSLVVAFAAPFIWLATLVMGRLPKFGVNVFAYLTGYYARLISYLYFLSNKYPPLLGAAEDYPVKVEFTPAKMGRLSILFRAVLAWPALFIGQLLSSGLFFVGVVEWAMVVILGEVPISIFLANYAAIRFIIRAQAWLLMLSSIYPNGLFGEDFRVQIARDVSKELYSLDVGSKVVPKFSEEKLQSHTKTSKVLVAGMLVVGLVVSAATQGSGISASASTSSSVTQFYNAKITQSHSSKSLVIAP